MESVSDARRLMLAPFLRGGYNVVNRHGASVLRITGGWERYENGNANNGIHALRVLRTVAIRSDPAGFRRLESRDCVSYMRRQSRSWYEVRRA